LYYHLLETRGRSFTWKPLIAGPEIWQVRIGKLTPGSHAYTLAGIVTGDYRKAAVLTQLGINFSSGGNLTLQEACEQKGLRVEDVMELLNREPSVAATPVMAYQEWEMGFLCRYLVNLHHAYVRNNNAFILEMAQKVTKTYGETYPELDKITPIFQRVAGELEKVIQHEEEVLFPLFERISNAWKHHRPGGAKPEVVAGPVYRVQAKHEQILEQFENIRELTSNYEAPRYAGYGFHILYKMLKEYEEDLLLHLHLENNILFPEALRLEEALGA